MPAVSVKKSLAKAKNQPAPARFSHRRLRLASLALAAALLGAWGTWQSAPVQERRVSNLGLAQLQAEAAQRPGDARLLYYLGARLNQQGRFAEAAPILESAALHDPDAPRIRDQWARALLGAGRPSIAYEELRQFAGTHPQEADAHRLLGKFYHTQRAWARAEEELGQAVARDPADAEAWAYLAAAHHEHGADAAALEAARRAAALRPRRFGDQYELAFLLARQGDPQAGAAYARALALGPNQALAHADYARWLLEHGMRPGVGPRAEAEAGRALALDPALGDARLTLGEAQARDGKDAQAVATLTQAAQALPRDPRPAARLMTLLHAQGRTHEANAWQQAYLSRLRQSSVWSSLMSALIVRPTSAPLNHQLAALLARQGDMAGCLRHEASALRCAPDAAPALRAAAADLSAGGDQTDARALSARAAAAAP